MGNRCRPLQKLDDKLEATGRTRSGIWFKRFGSVRSIGRCKVANFVPIFFAGTARSISKARMRVNSIALILIIPAKETGSRIWESNVEPEKDIKTHSTSANRKPIQARGPPMNVIKFAQAPGTDAAASGIFAQRSGLEKKTVQIIINRRNWE